MKLKHIGLFEGIGGFSLAACWAGWETVAWCEWNEFCQRVLKHHFPEAEGFGDITKTSFLKYANKIDILTGGFPCQPYSLAGKRLGKGDDRHLWPEMLRAIQEIQPTWVVGENVRGIVNWNGGLVFDEVQSDLEAEGYEVTPFLLPACSVDAPHKRDRVWFVAYSGGKRIESGAERIKGKCVSEGRQIRSEFAATFKSSITTNPSEQRCDDGGDGVTRGRGECKSIGGEIWDSVGATGSERTFTDTSNEGLQRGAVNGGVRGGRAKGDEHPTGLLPPSWENFPTQPPVCGGNDGIPPGLVDITFPKWRNESIKAFGNAIVPQVAFQIFKAINEFNKKSFQKT